MVVQLAIAIALSVLRAIVGRAPSDLRAITTALHAPETAHEVAIAAHAAGHHAEMTAESAAETDAMTAEDVRVSHETIGLVEPERGAKARHVRIGRPEWSDHATLSAPRVR